MRRWIWFPCLLGVCSLWEITEQDIYWQIRAGDELFRSWKFPVVDSWSFSAAGQPWMNIQWLSTLFFRAIYALGAEPALVLSRGVLIAILFTILMRTSLLISMSVPISAVGLALVYAATSFRLQMRSDLLVFIVFAGLLNLWMSEKRESTKRWGTLGLVCLSANLHAGSAPFVVLFSIFLLLGNGWRLSALAWCIAAIALLFATPYGLSILPVLKSHLFYYDYNLLPNPDHQKLAPHHFSISAFGVAGWAWLVATLMGWWSLWFSRWPVSLPSFRRLELCIPVAGVLTALALNRIRAFPYLMIFLLPLILAALLAIERQVLIKWRDRLAWALTGFILSSACIAGKLQWGWGASRKLFPVESTEFLRLTRPKGNIYHSYAHGAYLVWNLRDYQVFVDTRESPFVSLQPRILEARRSPGAIADIVREFDIRVTMMPFPAAIYSPKEGWKDAVEPFFSSMEWALVFMDRVSIVMFKRVQEHLELIEKNEYKLLRPSLPPGFYPRVRVRTALEDDLYSAELDRCLSQVPDLPFCLTSKAIWILSERETPSIEILSKARVLLEGALKIAPQDVYARTELMGVYSRMGMSEAAQRIRDSLGPAVTFSR